MEDLILFGIIGVCAFFVVHRIIRHFHDGKSSCSCCDEECEEKEQKSEDS
ncbi:MAG: hypothetical protein KAJ18_00225 [Candidatus Omnitrophica bacterium]|nr:hypothetical protein [Candidatus Omnitrophota bacterium]